MPEKVHLKSKYDWLVVFCPTIGIHFVVPSNLVIRGRFNTEADAQALINDIYKDFHMSDEDNTNE